MTPQTPYLLAAWILSASIVYAAPSPNTASANLAWSYDFAGNPGVMNFIVYYGQGNAPSNWDGMTNACRCYVTNAPTSGTNLTFTIDGLTRGTNYFFAVTAVADWGSESDYSNEARGTPPTKPGKPFNLTPMSIK